MTREKKSHLPQYVKSKDGLPHWALARGLK
jgi:hypothetical protein